MNKRMWWALIAGPGMAMVSLVLVFLVLGRSTAEATPGRMGTAPDLQPQTATFTVSGTVICQATGPLSGVEVYAWNQGTGLGDVKDVTDSSGAYRVTLEEGNYRLEFTPPPAAELNARAFTTTQILTDTILDVDFCVCSGAWVTETVDSDGNVGLCTSLALAPSYPYTPYIGYHDATSINLKLAWLSGTTWFSETVEHGGEGTSLALVPTYPYTPRIVHADWTTGWRLRYACRDGATWISMTVAGGRAADGSLALEPTYPYTPHISYFGYGDRKLFYAYLSGTAGYSGTWETKPVEPTGLDAGWGNSLALERTYPYTPHISYLDQANRDLKHAWLSGTTWVTEVVDSEGDVGWFTSLALNSSGIPRISYFDNTNRSLKFAWLSGTTWLSETVDKTGEQPWDGSTSLELDRADWPYISYYDATNGDLRLARFDGRVWIIQTVDGEGDVGRGSSLALDQGGCPHISYYDATYEDLRYAYIPRRPLVYLPLVVRNHSP